MPAFGTFRLDLEEERLWNGDDPVAVRRKPFAILKFLVANPRRLVTHQELLEGVWGGAAVSESAVRTQLHELRQILGEGVIETVVGRGFRFTATIREDAPVAEARPTRSLVGREVELAELRAAFDRAHGGVRQICFVTGEPGIGKTTLVDAFLDELPGSNVLALRGQCVEQYGTPEAYLAVIEMLGKLRHTRHGDEALAAFLRHAPAFMTGLPQLVTDAQHDELRKRATAGSESRMVRELIDAIEAIASMRTVVIVFEDLQWSDLATIDLLAMVGQRRERARLLVIATSRRAEAQTVSHPLNRVMRSLVARSGALSIDVERISEADVRALLATRFPDHAFPSALATAIDQMTHGTPLFVAMLLDDLIGRGMLAERDDRWALTATIDEIARHRPHGIEQLIDIQIDRLGQTEQRVLEAGGLIGLEFSASLVAAALELSEEAVDDVLDGFARRGQFVRRAETDEWPDGSVHTRYATTHGLIHEVCTGRVVPARRQRWHRAIGDKLEAIYAGRTAEVAQLLAMHFEKGQLSARAIEHYLVAADRMAKRFAGADTLSLYERALSLVARIPASAERDRAELRALQGVTSMHLRGHAGTSAEPLAQFERLLVLARAAGGPEVLARALITTSIRCSSIGQYLRAVQLCDEAELLVRERGVGGHVAELANTARVIAMIWQGMLADSHALLGRLIGQPIARTDDVFHLPDQDSIYAAYMTMLEWLLGRPDTALRLAEQANQLAITRGDPWTIGLLSTNLSRLHILIGSSADQICAPSLQVLAMPLAAVWHPPASLIMAWLAVESGTLSDASIAALIAGFHEGLSRGPMGPSQIVLPILELLAKLGRTDDGLAVLERVLDICRGRNERILESEIVRLRGELVEATDRDAALADYREAVRCAREIGATMLELRALNKLVPHDAGARGELAALLARFTEGLDTPDLVKARRLAE